MSNLKYSDVVFNEAEHTYTLNGKELHGITPVIEKYICEGKYDGIPSTVLAKAAERGSKIHKEIELLVSGFSLFVKEPEIEAFDATRMFYDINFIESEYLVSDEDFFASKIDIVDDQHNIYDVKTTSVLDKEYVSWQLSIYAYLFELQNGFPCGKLYAVWLRNGQCNIVEVKRIEKEYIIQLLSAAKNDEPFIKPKSELPMTAEEMKQLAELAKLEAAIIDIERQKKEAVARRDELKAGIEAKMREFGVDKYETDNLRFTLMSETTKKMVDSDKLKADGIYEKYTKEVAVKGYVKITIKQ